MKKPLVAIVGKPNVGKSTFFNKIAGSKISIVEDIPGVTRDRIFANAEWCGYQFQIVDTGGIDFHKEDEINKRIIEQANLAIDLADVIILFVDGKEGLTHHDLEVANHLRRAKAPKVLAVNKLDNYELEKTYEFYELGLGEPIAISAEQSKGLGDLLDEVVKYLKKSEKQTEDDSVKIALVGKPNAGKSSITNRLLGEDRVVVSSVAGTTRDAIDSPFRWNNKDYCLIDTAGLRKKAKIEPDSIERYSVIRSLNAIERADVCVLVIDASAGITEQDIKIAGLIHEQGKPSVIVVNKWDLIEKDEKSKKDFEKQFEIDLAFMKYYVTLYVSCETGQRIGQIMEKVDYVLANAKREIPMALFNNIITNAISVTEPPAKNGKKLKIIFGKQVATCPPTFSIYCNNSSLVENSYIRYLENSLRRAFDFKGTPIKVQFKNKNED
ncbi:MAG: ribosome biogenesis GTPase Der [Clostridia bacterium]|nr:ribosome biogenesis GTPase Der [Clostridia bacterium]